ncbi:Protein of unknown function [Roseovarius nanhaiticus]|uniref:DUF3047 domain-containing protein n=1 Tax=Roseovarius nanhaiticus TaxID=573024 RepID=A0A1N7HFJ6_9RHOB|nr:DUF3047 domain-containing protein [Roseovarius nanhaiticus]SEK97685.1 Protein of unknown function [Roseovarius nanhaiticus]SIS23645.1 Protein of unknown function [Roseovarius nanhaiticus]
MKRLILACMLAAAPLPSAAQHLGGWTEQKFSLFSSNTWAQGRDAVNVASDGTASMIWTALPEAEWDTRTASWTWSVSDSVPPTALDRKGGDDRNLSVYFVFMPAEIARQNQGASITRLLKVDEARVLMYVHGGASARGALLQSPYLGARGRTIVLRGAGTGQHSESVDLARDYTRAFGGNATSLVGLALSADSDDTGSAIRASLSGLRLQ